MSISYFENSIPNTPEPHFGGMTIEKLNYKGIYFYRIIDIYRIEFKSEFDLSQYGFILEDSLESISLFKGLIKKKCLPSHKITMDIELFLPHMSISWKYKRKKMTDSDAVMLGTYLVKRIITNLESDTFKKFIK